MAKQPRQVTFTREATGLVRGLGWWDSFALGFGSISVPTGIPIIFYTLNIALPGADVVTAMLIILPVGVIAFALTYIMLGTMMPRSGFDYVVNSRALSPPVGFGISWLFVITWLLIGAVYADLTTSIYLPSFLSSIGQVELANWLPSLLPRAIFDTAFVILGTVITLMSIKSFARVQTVCVLGSLVALVTMFALTGYLGVQGFAHAFDSVAGSGAYVALLAKGQAAGYKAAPFSLSQSLLAVPFVLFFIYGYTPMGLAGEMKTVRKSLIAAMLLASFVSWLAIMVMALIYYPILGVDFAHTIAYLAAMNPTASPFGSAPTLNNILAYVYGNTPLIAVLNLGIALNAFILVPQTMLFCIRHIFSWSFDRVVPAKLAEVSRFRTPWITALIVFVGMELMVVLYIFTGLIAALLNSAVLATPLGIGAGLSALLIPYRKRNWFEAAPAFIKTKVAGIPVLSIVGFTTAAGLAIYTIAVALFPQIGYPVTTLNLEFLAGWFILGIALYYAARLFRRRQGLDLSLIFTEIPPE